MPISGFQLNLFPRVKDTLEFYSIFKFIPKASDHTQTLSKKYSVDIERFPCFMHENVSFESITTRGIDGELGVVGGIKGSEFGSGIVIIEVLAVRWESIRELECVAV